MRKISIVIVTHNGKNLLKDCLASIIEKNDYPNYEIIVVDNDSSDSTKDMITSDFPEVRLIENDENVGAVIATNQGIKASKGDFIFRLDNDTLVKTKGFLTILVDMLTRNEKIGVIGCKLVSLTGENLYASGYVDDYGIARHYMNDDERDVGGLCTAAMMIRKDIINEIGLLDEGFSPMFYEDIDFTERARKKGYKTIYTPKVVVVHRTHGTIGKRSKNYRDFILSKGRIRYMLIHFSIYRLVKAIPYEIIRIINFTFKLKLGLLIKAYLENLEDIRNIIRIRRSLSRCSNARIKE
jgi:GT2 family glycosyltransferase